MERRKTMERDIRVKGDTGKLGKAHHWRLQYSK